MSSNHNDLATWASKARARGFNFIEIDCDTAEDVAEEIVDQANEIADLEQRVKQLEEALRPLKAIADAVFIDRDGREANSSKRDDDGLWGFDGTTITYGDLRRIRTLLNGGSNEPE